MGEDASEVKACQEGAITVSSHQLKIIFLYCLSNVEIWSSQRRGLQFELICFASNQDG